MNMDGEDFAGSDLAGSPNDQRNIAWASATGGNGDLEGVPHNAIAVNQVITVREDPVRMNGATMPNSRKAGDASSEEWIMEEDDNRRKNSKGSQ
jgi:hypothetical protein